VSDDTQTTTTNDDWIQNVEYANVVIIPNTTTTMIEDPGEEWIRHLDYAAVSKDIHDLQQEILRTTSKEESIQHFETIRSWRFLAAIVGIGTMWCTPNPITIVALSTWTYASWTMVAHHVSHGGYNKLSAKYNSRGFAIGSLKKRFEDWTDWMLPEAWNIEHNRLHHYHLGEEQDPDLVQRNLRVLREDTSSPFWKKRYFNIIPMMFVWKWFYYSPNTYKELVLHELRNSKKIIPAAMDPLKATTLRTLLFPNNEHERAVRKVIPLSDVFGKVLGPMFLTRFILLPAPLLVLPGILHHLFHTIPIGSTNYFQHAIVNLLLADFLTNIHSFLTIVTNHAGEDVYSFGNEEEEEDAVKPNSGAFYVRQIVGSVNYKSNYGNFSDFFHGYLNYQIEHHVWPDMSMYHYQKAAPKLQALCVKHHIPYICESVWTRLNKTIDIMIGRTSMKPFPTHLEPKKDKASRRRRNRTTNTTTNNQSSSITWKNDHGAIDE